METRILIPNGLQLVATDRLSKVNVIKESKSDSQEEDDNEEKPSSSSGHCETSDEPKSKQSKHSSCYEELEEKKSWKKECRGQPLHSSSSSSSLSPTCSDSSSENEAEIEYFMKNRRSVDQSGSSRNPFEYKKLATNTISEKNKEEEVKTKEQEKNDDHNEVKICAERVIEKGTVFTPNDGDVQIVYLKRIPDISKDDIRFIFGCFETITPISVSPPLPSSSESEPLVSPESTTTKATSPSPLLRDEKGYNSGSGCNLVRLCNWVRFLRRSSSTRRNNPIRKQAKDVVKVSSDSEDNDDSESRQNNVNTNQAKSKNVQFKKSISSECPNFTNDSSKMFLTTATSRKDENNINIIARFVDGRPLFEVTERLVPGTELVAYFDRNSIVNRSSTTLQYMTRAMSNLPTVTAAAAPFPSVNILSLPPPAPYNTSSTRISSSSLSPNLLKPAGSITRSGGTKKDRDEKNLLQQCQQRQLPVFHSLYNNNYCKVVNNAVCEDTQDKNQFPLWKDDLNDVRFGRKGDDRKNETSPIKEGSTEVPLDLSTFPVFKKNLKTQINEPLKVGTPFDSPDSNDDDMVKSIPSPVAGSESGCSSLFSIGNVLKHHQTPEQPSKLFQPYSLEVGKKSAGRDAFINALTTQQSSSLVSSLITPPSTSDDLLTGRNSTGIRTILRTRGRERSLLPCEVCGKAFDRPSLLKRHLRTHTGEKPHICDVCSKGFSTSSSLNTHRRIHSGEKPHQCPICGKRFTASSNLYYHRMTHNKEKPHKCMLCGKSFPTPGDLKSHQYVHSGSWPYTCPVCHRGFSKQTNLRNHLLLHSGTTSNASSNKSGDKPYACQICDKKFAQACNLRAHIKTHEEPDQVTSNCVICRREYHSTDLLMNGRCRSCLLSIPSPNKDNRRQSSTSPSPVLPSRINTAPSTVEQNKESFTSSYNSPSLLSQRIASSIGTTTSQQPLPSSVGHLGLPLSQFPGLSIPGLSNSLSFPPPVGSLQFQMNGTHSNTNAADLFASAAGSVPPTRNALLDQLFEWNYRMAKESVGIGSLGLSFMQQKLLESRMLTAQLMNTHGFGMNGAMQDILGLRSAMTSAEGFSPLDPVAPGESKFMPR